MKCKSLACIWSGSPPVHRVTATAVLQEPPTLYTGGSDGSIVWWNLISSIGKPELKPVALLCGHTAPVTDLAICFPFERSEKQKSITSINVLSHPNSVNCGALISACKDGILCVWSRTGGHCRRRRKLPPWAGSPYMMQPLFENKRYVCIACSFVKQEHQPVSSDDFMIDIGFKEPDCSRCTVIIIDSSTLAIVQTVFHGNLPIGPLKSMDVVLHAEDMEKQSLIVVDSFGKVLYLPILKDPDPKGKNVPVVPKNYSIPEVWDWGDEKRSLVAFSTCGHILALVHETHCTFRQVGNGTVLGRILFSDAKLYFDDKPYVVGGAFLQEDSTMPNNSLIKEFVAWNNRGAAIIYGLSYSCDILKFDVLSVIPAVSHSSGIGLSFSFIPVKKYLLRVESICFNVEEHASWRPNVTIWLLPQLNDNKGELNLVSTMHGESNLFNIWAKESTFAASVSPNHEVVEERTSISYEVDPWKLSLLPQGEVVDENPTSCSYDTHEGAQLVSSSMIISENHLLPYAVVYGFFNGDIELVRFHMFFAAADSFIEDMADKPDLQQKHRLSGHKGAVLCLASHQMENRPLGSSLNHLLLSGGMDCTVRVWDIDSGNLVTVLHQHVAPVRQIITAPCECKYPWSDCFLTVADDSCIALASLETLRVERLFPGHLYHPSKVLWDGVRGYIACLCLSGSDKADSLDVLYIWDVKTGARERFLRGASAHLMFDHFLRAINSNNLSCNFIRGNTSASSLIFPLIEPTISSQSHAEVYGKETSPIISKSTMTDNVVPKTSHVMKGMGSESSRSTSVLFRSERHPITSSCPFAGVSTLCFDLNSLMSLCSIDELSEDGSYIGQTAYLKGAKTSRATDAYHRLNAPEELGAVMSGSRCVNGKSDSVSDGFSDITPEHNEWVRSLEGCLLRFSLSFLHLWNVDTELDNLLITEMKLKRPDSFIVSSGILGDRGSMTLTFPGSSSTLELWKSSSEYSALRSLTMVSLAQHLIGLSHSYSSASRYLIMKSPASFSDFTQEYMSCTHRFGLPFILQQLMFEIIMNKILQTGQSITAYEVWLLILLALMRICLSFSALAAFYTRKFQQNILDIKSPLLQLLVSFWQNEFEHVRMAARSLFHCAASRAIPGPLCSLKSVHHVNFHSYPYKTSEKENGKTTERYPISDENLETPEDFVEQDYEITSWLESYEEQDWISCIAATTQDAMASQITVAAALAVWYPSLVKSRLAIMVIHPLLKLVMAMNEKYSASAAEILAEGMESTWKTCLGSEIPVLIGDIFFQVECVTSASAKASSQNSATSFNIRETLVGILLPSLAMADSFGFLHVIERQIWSTASDSPVHVVSLMTLIRVVRGSPRNLSPYLDKVVTFILQTMDPGNSTMRKCCFQSSMTALKEVVRVFPMIALNDASTRLAVGDAIGEINKASIRVYDMHSMSKIKVLDASGPPGLPTFLGGSLETTIATAISALSFSPDGEGLVAFSENGLMIRWWSLGSVWWEKLSRNLVPVQCTKLIFVPPWEGFSPNSTRSSIMAGALLGDGQANSPESSKASGEMDRLKQLIQNLDLSYRLEWVGERKVKLSQHAHELGTFQL